MSLLFSTTEHRLRLGDRLAFSLSVTNRLRRTALEVGGGAGVGTDRCPHRVLGFGHLAIERLVFMVDDRGGSNPLRPGLFHLEKAKSSDGTSAGAGAWRAAGRGSARGACDRTSCGVSSPACSLGSSTWSSCRPPCAKSRSAASSSWTRCQAISGSSAGTQRHSCCSLGHAKADTLR